MGGRKLDAVVLLLRSGDEALRWSGGCSRRAWHMLSEPESEVLFVFAIEGRGVTEPLRPVSWSIAMLQLLKL